MGIAVGYETEESRHSACGAADLTTLLPHENTSLMLHWTVRERALAALARVGASAFLALKVEALVFEHQALPQDVSFAK